MPAWLLPALFALVVWAIQRVVSKVALAKLTTSKFYLLNAAVSLAVYLPYVVAHPPEPGVRAPSVYRSSWRRRSG